MKKCMKSFHLY